jgi:hypothetical protein
MPDDTSPTDRGVTIVLAGNTGNRCLVALLAKGYRVWLEYHKLDKPVLHWDEHKPWYRAERDGNQFIANAPEELLGLVAMHEVRGDDWRPMTEAEQAAVERIYDTALTYDRNGDVVADE